MADTTTVTRTGNFVTLVFAGDGADFLFSADTTAGCGGQMPRPKIASITWKPDTDTDVLIVRDGSSTGAIVFSNEGDSDLQARTQLYGGGLGTRMNPSITIAHCTTLGAGTVTFEIA